MISPSHTTPAKSSVGPGEAALLDAILRFTSAPPPECQIPLSIEWRRLDGYERLHTTVDLGWWDAKVAIYIDGWYTHGRADVVERDARLRNALQLQGWTVLTYWNAQVERDPRRCADEVAAAYWSRSRQSITAA